MEEFSGYTVAYDHDEGPFPVYVTGFLAAALLVGWMATGNAFLFLFGAIALGFTYYHYPLLERGRTRIGANEYGIFIEGFGVIQWRAIERIDLAVFAVRVLTLHELNIVLKQPLNSALLADWRRIPWWRMPMRLPWKMTHAGVIRVPLDPLDKEPQEVHRNLQRMWRYYRS